VFVAVFCSGIGSLAILMQIIMMYFREAVLALLVGIVPIAASLSMTGVGMAWLRRLLAWIGAFLIYKLAAAVILFAAVRALTEAKDLNGVILGDTLLVMGVLALPALLRLVRPVFNS
jgi:hypothetical protein